MTSAAAAARACLEKTLEKCRQEQLSTGDVVERDWSVESEIRSGTEKVKIVIWFNAKGQLTPRIQGKSSELKSVVEQALHEDASTDSAFLSPDVQEWIGVDESGKGDYFGPLVTAAVLVTPAARELLKTLLIRDSKDLKDAAIAKTAAQIREICGDGVTVVLTMPPRYNEIVGTQINSGKSQSLLAWQHARAIENLLELHPETRHAISDKFADESVVRRALMERGKKIQLVQRTKAESDMAVAAASIIARTSSYSAFAHFRNRPTASCPWGLHGRMPSARQYGTSFKTKGQRR